MFALVYRGPFNPSTESDLPLICSGAIILWEQARCPWRGTPGDCEQCRRCARARCAATPDPAPDPSRADRRAGTMPGGTDGAQQAMGSALNGGSINPLGDKRHVTHCDPIRPLARGDRREFDAGRARILRRRFPVRCGFPARADRRADCRPRRRHGRRIGEGDASHCFGR